MSDRSAETSPGESWNFYEDGVTQSMLATFLACPEKHRLRNIEMLQREGSKTALHIGSIVHEALDATYSAHKEHHLTPADAGSFCADYLWLAEQSAQDELQALGMASVSDLEDMSQNYGIATAMLEHYFKQWPQDFRDKKWVILEEEFKVPFKLLSGQTTYLRGKIDGAFTAPLLVPNPDGTSPPLREERLWLFESKTKSNIADPTLPDRIPFDLQVCFYSQMLKGVTGEQPVGVEYNLIKRPALRRGKTESLADYVARCEEDIRSKQRDYYIRYQATIQREGMERWMGEFYQMLDMMERHYLGEFNFRNPTACVERWGGCEFLPLCGHGRTDGITRREQVFPELPSANQPQLEVIP